MSNRPARARAATLAVASALVCALVASPIRAQKPSPASKPVQKPGRVSDSVKKKKADKGRAPLKGHAKAVTGIAYSPDGKTLASSSEDKTR